MPHRDRTLSNLHGYGFFPAYADHKCLGAYSSYPPTKASLRTPPGNRFVGRQTDFISSLHTKHSSASTPATHHFVEAVEKPACYYYRNEAIPQSPSRRDNERRNYSCPYLELSVSPAFYTEFILFIPVIHKI